MARLVWLGCVLSMSVAIGCGDDGGSDDGNAGSGGGDGTGQSVLGVDGSAILSELSAADAESACMALADSINDDIGSVGQRAVCVVAAYTEIVLASGSTDFDVAMCESMVDACVADGPQEDPAATADCTSGLMTCDLTAADLEDCATDGLEALDEVLANLTCESLQDAQNALAAIEDYQNVGQVEACQTLTASCSDLDVFSL